MQRLKSLTNRVLRARGFEVRRWDYTNPFFQENAALLDPRIDTIIDVGANTGQYGKRIRRSLPNTPIYSFEPLPDAFRDLSLNLAHDKNWNAYNFGIGRNRTSKEFTIAGNSQSSSFLNMQDSHINAAPLSKPIGKISVQIETLDNFSAQFGNQIYLKIDTQGYELEVIAGATETINKALYVYIESSFVELYQGSPLAHEVMAAMYERGFCVHTITPGFSDFRDARLLQADILFSRKP